MKTSGTTEKRLLPAIAVTHGPKQHYFGYYDKHQFDPSNRYLLGVECDIIGRLQRAEDTATVGIIDLEHENEWTPLAETKAWNWQMGCMAEWLPGTEKKIIYNDRREGEFVSVIRDINKGEERVLPRPVFEIAPDGRSALTVNFSRLWDVRPETGYCGLKDPWGDEPAPDEDGIFHIDLNTGELDLIISHCDMAEFQPVAEMPRDSKRYFTHLLFNEDGSRFMFWYRCTSSKGGWPSCRSGIYTATPDGKNIYVLNNSNSHSTWFGHDKVLAWAIHKDKGMHNYLFTDQTKDLEIMGEGILEFNGHATFSPNKKWLLTDIPPDEKSERTLVLYSCADKGCFAIGHFYSMSELEKSTCRYLRCDLHPRWNRNGTQVCIDSTHEGSRQMYLLDVRDIVE